MGDSPSMLEKTKVIKEVFTLKGAACPQIISSYVLLLLLHITMANQEAKLLWVECDKLLTHTLL